MFKAILLMIIIALIGIFPAGAFAEEPGVFDASEFFYGDTINNTASLKAERFSKSPEIEPRVINLSNANFFYGEDMKPEQVINTAIESHGRNVNTATPAKNQLSPGDFYGYTEPVRINEKCENC